MKLLKPVLAVVTATVAYLLLWPTGVDPQTWTPQAPPTDAVYAYNERLKNIQKLASGIGKGPETVNVDAAGRLYAGYADGRILQLSPNAGSYLEMADTGGRPLGITFGPDGGLIIADARKGLLQVGAKATPLLDGIDGRPFGFINDVDNTLMDKNVYFSESSTKFHFDQQMRDLLEHGANGRLLEYNVVSKKARVLIDGLHFANGVAVGPGDAYVLVSEMGEYRIWRYWLKGDKAGTRDIFIDNLPGFPDNISYNNRDRFWVALAAPRDSLLDRLLPGSIWLRKLAARLPAFLLGGGGGKHAFVLALDTDGKVIENLQYAGADAYAPITSVREFGPWLYFGSVSYPGIGRLPLNQIVPGSRPPPPGWDKVPSSSQIPLTHSSEEEREEQERAQEEKSRQQGKQPP